MRALPTRTLPLSCWPLVRNKPCVPCFSVSICRRSGFHLLRSANTYLHLGIATSSILYAYLFSTGAFCVCVFHMACGRLMLTGSRSAPATCAYTAHALYRAAPQCHSSRRACYLWRVPSARCLCSERGWLHSIGFSRRSAAHAPRFSRYVARHCTTAQRARVPGMTRSLFSSPRAATSSQARLQHAGSVFIYRETTAAAHARA